MSIVPIETMENIFGGLTRCHISTRSSRGRSRRGGGGGSGGSDSGTKSSSSSSSTSSVRQLSACVRGCCRRVVYGQTDDCTCFLVVCLVRCSRVPRSVVLMAIRTTLAREKM